VAGGQTVAAGQRSRRSDRNEGIFGGLEFGVWVGSGLWFVIPSPEPLLIFGLAIVPGVVQDIRRPLPATDVQGSRQACVNPIEPVEQRLPHPIICSQPHLRPPVPHPSSGRCGKAPTGRLAKCQAATCAEALCSALAPVPASERQQAFRIGVCGNHGPGGISARKAGTSMRLSKGMARTGISRAEGVARSRTLPARACAGWQIGPAALCPVGRCRPSQPGHR